MWNLSLFVVVWKIWLKRNNRVFRDRSNEVAMVVDFFVSSVSECTSRAQEFVDVPLHDLHLSWDACFQGRRKVNLVLGVLWLHPPQGVLKLNFDSSFRSESIGGYGGVIGDIFGQVLCNFLGLASYLSLLTLTRRRFTLCLWVVVSWQRLRHIMLSLKEIRFQLFSGD